MSSIVFARYGEPDKGEWRDYFIDFNRVSFAWQFRAPRVDTVAAWCKEIVSEGIVYGVAGEREAKLVPVVDEVPPDAQGYYCAGRAFIEGKLQWILRPTDLPSASESKRSQGYSVTVFDEPNGGYLGSELDHSPANIAKYFTGQSAKGRSVAGYARQHWRAIRQIRPVGCTEREVEFAMRSDEIGGPAYTYTLQYVDEPDTYEFEGELCGVMYTAARGSPLIAHRAYLLLRQPVGTSPAPDQDQPGLDPGPGQKKGTSGSAGLGVLIAGGVGLVLLRRFFG